MQDGFELYLHGFIVTDDGRWVVVQQGMNGERRQARRYHWLSEGLTSFVDEPHAAIEGPGQGEIVNLTDRRAEASRRGQLELLASLGPDGIARELAALEARARQRAAGCRPQQPLLPHLVLPAITTSAQATSCCGGCTAISLRPPIAARPTSPSCCSRPGVGARTVRALAMVAEVVHGAPYRFCDPARFSFAHGGKDGHPFPVPLRVYDETIRVLKSAVQNARLGREEELARVAAARRAGAPARTPRVGPFGRRR